MSQKKVNKKNHTSGLKPLDHTVFLIKLLILMGEEKCSVILTKCAYFAKKVTNVWLTLTL